MLRAEKSARALRSALERINLTAEGRLLDDDIINAVVQPGSPSKSATVLFLTATRARSAGRALRPDRSPSAQPGRRSDCCWMPRRRRLRRRVEHAPLLGVRHIVSLGMHVPDTTPNVRDAAGCCTGATTTMRDPGISAARICGQDGAGGGYYEKRGILHRLNTERPPEQVLASTLRF
jgi:hypothetical protein